MDAPCGKDALCMCLQVQGEDGDSLDKAVKLIAEYKERISRVVSRQSEVEQLLSDLAQSHQPVRRVACTLASRCRPARRHLPRDTEAWGSGLGADNESREMEVGPNVPSEF